jgi:hypothetical protein
LWGFTITLGYSRRMMAEGATDQKLGTLLRMHERAFQEWNGVPEEILYDRMRTIWTGTDALSAAISAVGNTLDRYIYQWNETSVSALWSGNTWIVKRRKPWVTIQYPGYCVGVTPEGKAACQKTGNTIAAFMKSMYGNPASLAFPCDN